MADRLTKPAVIAIQNNLISNGKPDVQTGVTIEDIGYDLAVVEVKRILGSSRYDDVVDLGTSDADYQTLVQALGRFAFYYAMPALNLRLTKKGGFMRSTGLVENQNELMSKRELESYRDDKIREGTILCQTLHVSDDLKPFKSGAAETVGWGL